MCCLENSDPTWLWGTSSLPHARPALGAEPGTAPAVLPEVWVARADGDTVG